MKTRHAVTPVLLLTALTGLAYADTGMDSTPTLAAPGIFGGLGGLFDARLRRLVDLTEQGQLDEADAFYGANASSLNQNSGISSALQTLAKYLNNRYNDKADALSAQLAASAPANAASWTKTTAALNQSRALLEQYGHYNTFHIASFRSPKMTALSTAVTRATTQLQSDAGTAFAGYDHSRADFFTNYPLALDTASQQKITEANLNVWLKFLSAEHAPALLKNYYPALRAEAARRSVTLAYEKALLQQHGWSSPLNISQVWALASELQQAGLDNRFMSAPRAALVLTGATPGPLPAGWDMNGAALGLPYLLTSRDDLAGQLDRLAKAGFYDVVIFDPTRAGQITSLKDLTAAANGHASATAERRQEQQVGIYYVDLRNKLVYRSKQDGNHSDSDTIYGRFDAKDPQKTELEKKTRSVLAELGKPAEGSVISAAQLVPATLDKPVTGSQWQFTDLDRLLKEDDITFSHRLQEKIRQAHTSSADIAEALVVDLDSNNDDAPAGSNALPEDADCKAFGVALPPEQSAALWHGALASVADLNGEHVSGSYSFMDAHEDIANLREDVARDSGSADRDQAMSTALAALNSAAATLGQHLTLAQKFVDADAVDGPENYYSQRLNNAASNIVAARAAAVRPAVVADLYRVYAYVYAEKSHYDGASTPAVFASVDQMLQQIGKRLADEDEQLAKTLEDGAGNEALEAANTSIQARCNGSPVVAKADAADKDQDDDTDDKDDDGATVAAVPTQPPLTATPISTAAAAPTDTDSDDDKAASTDMASKDDSDDSSDDDAPAGTQLATAAADTASK